MFSAAENDSMKSMAESFRLLGERIAETGDEMERFGTKIREDVARQVALLPLVERARYDALVAAGRGIVDALVECKSGGPGET